MKIQKTLTRTEVEVSYVDYDVLTKAVDARNCTVFIDGKYSERAVKKALAKDGIKQFYTTNINEVKVVYECELSDFLKIATLKQDDKGEQE